MMKRLVCFLWGHKWRLYKKNYVSNWIYEYWWEELDRCWRCDKRRDAAGDSPLKEGK